MDAYVEKEYPEEVANGGKEDKSWRKDIMSEVAKVFYIFSIHDEILFLLSLIHLYS